MSYESLRRRPTGVIRKDGYRWNAASGRWYRCKEGGAMQAVLKIYPRAICRRFRVTARTSPHNVYAYEVRYSLAGTKPLGSGGSPVAAWMDARTNLLAEALTT